MVDVTEEEMDNPTFKSDTVLSDVHLHCPNKRRLMVRLNAVGQPAIISIEHFGNHVKKLGCFLHAHKSCDMKRTTFAAVLAYDNVKNYKLGLRKKRIIIWTLIGSNPVFLSYFKLLWNTEGLASEKCVRESSTEREYQYRSGDELGDKGRKKLRKEKELNSEGVEALLDDDGDLEVVRRPRSASDVEAEDLLRDRVYPVILMKGREDAFEDEEECTCSDIVKIEHTMATPLEDVGKQVWRAAFLLADYILFKRDTFRCCSVLELGGGTGITSIIMGMVAKRVYCTDVGEDLLAMCEQNVVLNKHLMELGRGEVKVKKLDWLKEEFCTDPEALYSWSEEEIADLYEHCTVIMAADVFYDDGLTDALFRTLYRITHNLRNSCTVYLALEKRLNFTLRHMDVTCEAYSHFRNTLNDLENLQDRKIKYTVEPIKADFCQFLIYERIEQLELWKIIAEQLT